MIALSAPLWRKIMSELDCTVLLSGGDSTTFRTVLTDSAAVRSKLQHLAAMVKRQKAQAGSSTSTEAASLILPSLYLGPCSAASNKAFLDANAITHVLSIGSTPASKVDGITYHRLALNDSATSLLSKVTDEACRVIDGALASRGRGRGSGGAGAGKILVHCSAGISRSPSLVVAYLMKARGMSLRAALGQVVRARPQVSPNPGFLRQLKALEEELYGAVSLDVEELPKREKDRLALFADDAEVARADGAAEKGGE